MQGEAKQAPQSGTKIVFVKDVAMRNGALMKLCHCVDSEIDPDTGCEWKGAVEDRWLPVEELRD